MCSARADNASNRMGLADRQTIALHSSRVGTHRPREYENELIHSSSSSRHGPNDDCSPEVANTFFGWPRFQKKQSTDSTVIFGKHCHSDNMF
ncbi:hypothetical protein V1477_006501 [Vespula maculifrons]|uniref:Uncharacterized protein n=1 Tax=Vespula maculifrons TaxID=7453 RepID=A0ABD2CJR4_VESMC